MKSIVKGESGRPTLVAIALVMLVAWPEDVRADEPYLEVVQAGGGSSVYSLSEIERIGFEGDTLLVVQAGGSDTFALESIVRIDFHWQPTGIESPEDAAALVKALHLFQNQPNPFSPKTKIEFSLPQAGRVELKVYAVSGGLVRTLVAGRRSAGLHNVSWDGRDSNGEKVASGVYFYNLTAPGINECRKMILLP
jgi:hypothetical protein